MKGQGTRTMAYDQGPSKRELGLSTKDPLHMPWDKIPKTTDKESRTKAQEQEPKCYGKRPREKDLRQRKIILVHMPQKATCM